jgi:hypothetical protein
MKDESDRQASTRHAAAPVVVVALAIGVLLAAAFYARPAPDALAHEADALSVVHLDAALRGGEFLPRRP